MSKERKSPHRLKHVEHPFAMPVEIKLLAAGDVFVRQGAPCMRVHMSPSEINHPKGQVPIVNLITGSVWTVPEYEPVYPAYDVDLKLSTTRRETDASQ